MADDYIKRSDALSEIDEWMESVGTALIGKGLSYYAELQGCIEDCKAADVAPVVHGRWLNKKEWHLGRWVAWLECSCCGEHDDNAEMYEMLPFGAAPSNYCPNCGAKMDLEDPI